MKILASTIVSLLLAVTPVLAEEFALPDMTVEHPKPPQRKLSPPGTHTNSALTPSKSQWSSDETDKPAQSFGDLSGPCDGCKFSVIVKQVPILPRPGFDPSE